MKTQNTTTGAANTTAARSFLGLSIPRHTPGPWSLGASYDSNPHGDFEVFGAEFGHYGTGRVAVVDRRAGAATFIESTNPQTARLTAEANARLIAAAPELLDALREIESMAREIKRSHIANVIVCKCMDLIAKVEV
jgi:hypothetical protein